MPPLAQSHFCKTCGETDPEKFKGRMKGTCYKCHKQKYRAYYRRDRTGESFLCKECGEDSTVKFNPNSKSLCKSCSYSPRPRKKIVVTSKPVREKSIRYKCKKCDKTGEMHFYKNCPYICIDCYNFRATRYYYPFYDDLVKIQGGEVCCLCSRTAKETGHRRLSVDHDHETGLVRGLLCYECNWKIGQFTSDFGRKALLYINKPPAMLLAIQFPEKMKRTSNTI